MFSGQGRRPPVSSRLAVSSRFSVCLSDTLTEPWSPIYYCVSLGKYIHLLNISRHDKQNITGKS